MSLVETLSVCREGNKIWICVSFIANCPPSELPSSTAPDNSPFICYTTLVLSLVLLTDSIHNQHSLCTTDQCL